MIALRPYQQAMLDAARTSYRAGHRAVLFNLPTGGGKTVTASTVVHGAALKGRRVWWLAHRRELSEQASQTFHNLDIPHGMVNAGRVTDPAALVQVASIQTIARRHDRLPAPDLIVFDECHHIGAAQWEALFNAYPAAKILGLTATPWRLDGQGLGKWFSEMITGPTVADLIANGSLSPYRLFAPATPDLAGVGTVAGDYKRGALSAAMNKPAIVGDAIGHYRRLCDGKRAVAFAAGVENSRAIAAQFNFAGIPAEHVDGSMPAEMRDAAVARFRRGETLILSNADLFGEGFDVPAIEAAILLRPTQSLSLYLQQVGRALRPAPGKSEAIILDHAGNSIKHGLPDDVREWSLTDREKRARREVSEVPVRQCEECFFVYRPAPSCPCCGHTPAVKAREIEVIEGTLEEVSRKAEQAKRERWAEERECDTLADWQALGRARGYKSGWAYARWQARQARQAA
jgi:superfamily II DNA or RNA helicase